MDKHATLNMLLSSLFENNQLHNWSIFEDNSDFINVRIRFTKHEDTAEPAQNISYRRVSEAQSKRSRERAARHRDAASRRTNPTAETTVENARSDGHLDLSETGPLVLFMSPESVEPQSPEMSDILPGSSPVIHGEEVASSTSDISIQTTVAHATCGEKLAIKNDVSERIIVNAVTGQSHELNIVPDRNKLSQHLSKADITIENIGCYLCSFKIEESFGRKMRRTLQCIACSRYVCASCYRTKPIINGHTIACDSKSYSFVT